jgi:hypothetical protein
MSGAVGPSQERAQVLRSQGVGVTREPPGLRGITCSRTVVRAQPAGSPRRAPIGSRRRHERSGDQLSWRLWTREAHVALDHHEPIKIGGR